MDDYNSYTVIGSTRDDAIGESFDKIGRLIGIPYPAGKGFDALSAEGFVSVTGKDEISYEDFARYKIKEKYSWHLPSPALAGENLDFSFSGLKTAAINLLHRYEQTKEELPRAHFAAAYTYEAIEALAKKVAQALDENKGAPLVVAGGVAANSHIRARLSSLCKKMGRKMHVPPLSLCGDNAAMIAAEGYYRYRSGALADSTLNGSAAD